MAAAASSRNRGCLRAPERDVLQRRGEERAGALSPQATERHAASHAGRRSFLWCTPARRPCGCACVVAASAHYHEPRYYHRAGPGVSACARMRAANHRLRERPHRDSNHDELVCASFAKLSFNYYRTTNRDAKIELFLCIQVVSNPTIVELVQGWESSDTHRTCFRV